MRVINWSKKVYCIVSLSIILNVFSGYCWAQELEQKAASFEELIEKESLKWQGRTGSSGYLDRYFSNAIKGPGPFVPVKGLDDVNAVPFLIDVLEKGTWIKDNKEMTGYITHRGQCYAALCLGSIGDERAFEPLIETLENGLTDSIGFFKISDYAAFALGMLGDPNAVGPLIKALKEGKCNELVAIGSLGKLNDIRAIKPIIDYISNQESIDTLIPATLQSLSRVGFNSRNPELEAFGMDTKSPSLSSAKFWQVWWENKDEIAKLLFEKNYAGWKEFQTTGIIRINTTNYNKAITNMKKNMIQGGVPTLPYLIDAIEKGDESLIPVVAQMTHREVRTKIPKDGMRPLMNIEPETNKNLPEKATIAETLKWWKENKDAWTLKDSD